MSTSNILTKNAMTHVVIKPTTRSKLEFKKVKKTTTESNLKENKEFKRFKSFLNDN